MDKDQTTEKLPAIGISVTANINGDRQLVLQYFVAGEASAADRNAAVIMLNDMIDVAQARYEIKAFEDEIEKMERSLEQAKLDLPKVDIVFEEQMKALESQAAEWDGKADAAFKAGYSRHVNSGRNGEYKPAGAEKQMVEGPKAEAAAIRKTIETKRAEAALERQQHEKSIQHFEENIASRRAAIAKREAILKK